MFAGVFCNSWDETNWDSTTETGTKTLTLGENVKSFLMLKDYPQTPEQFQLFTKEFVNQLSMDFSTDAFVRLTWNLMGSNNPEKVSVQPDEYDGRDIVLSPTASTTKSYLTKKGWLKIGDTLGTLAQVRQSPSMQITINNNLERTPALFEEESIENSLGDFVIDGNVDIYNVDALGTSLYNDAVAGADKVMQVKVERTVGTRTTAYILTLDVHLKAPSESKNGNKLQFSVGYQVNKTTNLKLEKVVTDTSI